VGGWKSDRRKTAVISIILMGNVFE